MDIGMDATKSDPLSERRELDDNDDFFDNPVCPCEEIDPDPQSEYEVPGEWITYTGEVDMSIFECAAREAQIEFQEELRAYASSSTQDAVAPGESVLGEANLGDAALGEVTEGEAVQSVLITKDEKPAEEITEQNQLVLDKDAESETTAEKGSSSGGRCVG